MYHFEKITDFEGNSTVFQCNFIAIMQLLTSLGTELVNILVILEATNALEVLMNFVALEAIAKLDNIYYSSIRSEPLMKAITEDQPEITETKKSIVEKGKLGEVKCQRFLYKFLMCFYGPYYYYFPMIIPIVSFFSTYVPTK